MIYQIRFWFLWWLLILNIDNVIIRLAATSVFPKQCIVANNHVLLLNHTDGSRNGHHHGIKNINMKGIASYDDIMKYKGFIHNIIPRFVHSFRNDNHNTKVSSTKTINKKKFLKCNMFSVTNDFPFRMKRKRSIVVSLDATKLAKQSYTRSDPSSILIRGGNDDVGRRAVRSFIILIVGIVLGNITYFPNFMMCDEGTPIAHASAKMGITASFLFIAGGIYGFITNKGSWWVLAPAFICQTLPFLMVKLFSSNS